MTMLSPSSHNTDDSRTPLECGSNKTAGGGGSGSDLKQESILRDRQMAPSNTAAGAVSGWRGAIGEQLQPPTGAPGNSHKHPNHIERTISLQNAYEKSPPSLRLKGTIQNQQK